MNKIRLILKLTLELEQSLLGCQSVVRNGIRYCWVKTTESERKHIHLTDTTYRSFSTVNWTRPKHWVLAPQFLPEGWTLNSWEQYWGVQLKTFVKLITNVHPIGNSKYTVQSPASLCTKPTTIHSAYYPLQFTLQNLWLQSSLIATRNCNKSISF